MDFLKIVTSDEETRWINFTQVSRVTVANEAPRGEPILVVVFADGCPDTRLTIRGDDDVNRKCIDQITDHLDQRCTPS